MKKVPLNIGIVTVSAFEAGNIPISNLVDVLYYLSDKLYAIMVNGGGRLRKDDDKIHVFGLQYKGGANLFTRVLNYTYRQLGISFVRQGG